MFHARTSLLALSFAVLFLGACGGGGLAPVSGASKASLTGEVAAIDGQDTYLSGVVLQLTETGAVAVTASDGSFAFDEVPTGTLSLELLSQPRVYPTSSGGSTGGSPGGYRGGGGHHGAPFDDDDIDDGESAGEGDVFIHRVRERERVHVRLHLREGAICEMECVREQHRECEVEILMTATAAGEAEGLAGKLELETRDDRERLEVRVWDATPGVELEVVVISLEHDEESLGQVMIGDDGTAAWTRDTSLGDALPFDVLAVGDLEDYVVEVRAAATGVTWLAAEVPAMPPFKWRGQPPSAGS